MTGTNRLSLTNLTEIRRTLPLVASVLFVVSLVFPMWRIVLTAPQYPTRDLPVTLYAYPRLGGAYQEVGTLNHYVGFHFPDPVLIEPNYEVSEAAVAMPEWSLAPLLFVVLALGALFVALSPESKIERRLKYYFASLIGILVIVLVWLQFRLYQAGHNLDPNAPMTGVDGFTPPVLGPYGVANISGFAWLDTGGYMVVVGIVLVGFAYLARESDATVRELPEFVGDANDRIRERA